MVFIEVSNLSKQFEDLTALDSVTFSIEKGEILGILGPSGCGKTTILKIILGLLSPTNGDIRLEGKSILNIPAELRNFGYIPQNLALFPHLSVYENIAFGLNAKNWEKTLISEKVESLIKLLELEQQENKLPHEISGGQQQRVALARALAPEPTLLLMDEPLSSLDTTLSFHLRWEVRKIIKKTTTTAIFVTHNPEEAISICDRLVLMDTGQTIQTISSKEVFKSPASIKVLQILGKSNIFPVKNHIKDDSGVEFLQTSLGTLPHPNFAPDKPILGCWIPEGDISLENENTVNDLNFNLEITGELLGIVWGRINHRFIFKLPDNTQIAVQLPSTRTSFPEIGERVSLNIPHEKIRWF